MDASLYDIECVALAVLVMGFSLTYAVRRLARTRPGFDVWRPLAVGVALRFVVIATISLSGLGLSLRGGDEIGFLQNARLIAQSSFDSPLWFPGQFHRGHEILFALQIKFGDFPEGALRVTQVGIAVLGLLLIVAAIYDLAGPRAARVAAWALALEPASLLYNGILHREALLVLASGLVIFGGSKIWVKLELRGILLFGLGCVVAVSVRPYAGWFLITAGVVLILHASMRHVGSKLRSVPLIYGVAIVIAAATPAVLSLTSEDNLQQTLQVSQNTNTDPNAVRGTTSSNNLSLEHVDFSTRSNLITNLPQRVRDLLVRPYPWQIQNTSQQLGAMGTLVAIAVLFLLLRFIRRNRGQVLALAGPFIYPALFLTIAYALSVGNAGTGFRYRTHLVVLGIAMVVVLREHALRRAATAVEKTRGEQRLAASVVATAQGARAAVASERRTL